MSEKIPQSRPSRGALSLFWLGKSQPNDLDQPALAKRPRASLHATFISTSPPWTTSAVIGVSRGCTPGLKPPKMR